MPIPLVKAHAYGNDFLYVRRALVHDANLDPVQLAVRACARHTGIGADGLILFEETTEGAGMRLINADGSHAEVSGNGVRGLGALLARERGWHEDKGGQRQLTIQTDAGPKRLSLLQTDGATRFAFRAEMGEPAAIASVRLEVAGERIDAIRLDMGNPQCVLIDRLEPSRLARLGRALQDHPAFPEAVNFELAEVVDRRHLRILIWERGVGPTQSSGTGSCAAAVAAITAGVVERSVDVDAPGGTQRVDWTPEGVFLTGWAEVIAEASWIANADAAGSPSDR